MSHFRDVTGDFAVSSQISVADIEVARADGFRLIVNNRPDGEAPDQPASADIRSAAQAAGLDYIHIPVIGRPNAAQVAAMRGALHAAAGPGLAFCRSGTRSIMTWALGRLVEGEESSADVIALARGAGYDLSGFLSN